MVEVLEPAVLSQVVSTMTDSATTMTSETARAYDLK